MKDMITHGEKYGPAMAITEQTEADAYFEECIQHNMRFGSSRAEAETTEKANLGYWAGYYGEATRRRVERLFRCSHPIFGSVEEFGVPTAAEAVKAGMEMAAPEATEKANLGYWAGYHGEYRK